MENQVTVQKSWSFLAFVKEFGKPEYLTSTNKITGEVFHSIGFRDRETNNLTLCHFGATTQDYSKQDIVENKKDLMVGLNSNGKYTLYKGGLHGEEILL